MCQWRGKGDLTEEEGAWHAAFVPRILSTGALHNLSLCAVRITGCERVSPCDVEGLPAAMFVAGHTGSSGGFTLSALVLANITCLQTNRERQCNSKTYFTCNCVTKWFLYLVITIVWHWLEYYRLHRRNIRKFYFRYIKRTNYMGPACEDTQKTTINLCICGRKREFMATFIRSISCDRL